ncbi:MAG: pseudoazurin [Pseudomonadota bacterium]
MSMNRRTVLVSAASMAVVAGTNLKADGHATHVVEMLNKHPEDKKQKMVFYPRTLKVKAGDTVMFKSVDKGHNSEAIGDMTPEGSEGWKGKISKDVEVTFDMPGVYGYKCTPHTAVGMVGLVVVEGEGMLDNLEAAKGVKQRGKAKKAFQEIWEEAEAAGMFEETTA